MGCPVQGLELHWMILGGSFQLWTFPDSVIQWGDPKLWHPGHPHCDFALPLEEPNAPHPRINQVILTKCSEHEET